MGQSESVLTGEKAFIFVSDKLGEEYDQSRKIVHKSRKINANNRVILVTIWR